jgi:hypothetical protein
VNEHIRFPYIRTESGAAQREPQVGDLGVVVGFVDIPQTIAYTNYKEQSLANIFPIDSPTVAIAVFYQWNKSNDGSEIYAWRRHLGEEGTPTAFLALYDEASGDLGEFQAAVIENSIACLNQLVGQRDSKRPIVGGSEEIGA